MAYIKVPDGLPGIVGPMAFSPQTSKPLNDLAEVLLRSDNSMSRGFRELMATYVSYLNDCFFCQNAHGGLAQHYMQCEMSDIDNIKQNYLSANLTDKEKSLLEIAASVQQSGKKVTPQQIDKASLRNTSVSSSWVIF